MSIPIASFTEAVEARTARVAVSASAARGQGIGVVRAGRDFLSKLSLAQFAERRPTRFAQTLERQTNSLCSALPKGCRSWGLARKLINIFLRDALYTTYLVREYGLLIAEPHLEIPLDSITAKRLRAEAGPHNLPRWVGVKHLTPGVRGWILRR